MSYGNYQAPPPPNYPRFSEHVPPDGRSGCMTLFLVGLGAMHVVAAVIFCEGISRINNGLLGIVGGIIIFGGLIGIIGLWNWQKWGYYTLMAVFGINLLLGFASGDLREVIVRGLVLGALFQLYNDKMELLN